MAKNDRFGNDGVIPRRRSGGGASSFMAINSAIEDYGIARENATKDIAGQIAVYGREIAKGNIGGDAKVVMNNLDKLLNSAGIRTAEESAAVMKLAFAKLVQNL